MVKDGGLKSRCEWLLEAQYIDGIHTPADAHSFLNDRLPTHF